ncbi:MAG: PilZ domain-containing protein [Myxococcota bacterium]
MSDTKAADVIPEEGADQRKAPRVEVHFETQYEERLLKGQGVVRNISASGALIDDADPRLPVGSEVSLSFSLQPDTLPLRIRGSVVRETERGFGVTFLAMDARTRKVLKASIHRALKSST